MRRPPLPTPRLHAAARAALWMPQGRGVQALAGAALAVFAVLVVLAALLLGACVESVPNRAQRPLVPPEEDLVALLPSGAEAVFDLDVSGLRSAPLGGRLFTALPAGLQDELAALSDAPLQQVDALALSVTGLGGEHPEALWLARGAIDAPRLRERFLARTPAAAVQHYHGQELLEPPAPVASGGLALGVLGPRAVVLGSRLGVRQVIDNFHGTGAGARSEVELAAALGRAPRSRSGRPALWFALLPGSALRERLQKADLAELGADASFVSGAVALGDGIDIGVVAGYRELGVAKDVALRLRERIEALRRRPVLRSAGLARHLQAIAVQAVPASAKRRMAEVHLALRLDQGDADDLFTRLEVLRRLLDSTIHR